MLSLSLKSADALLMVVPTMVINTPSCPNHGGKQDDARTNTDIGGKLSGGKQLQRVPSTLAIGDLCKLD